MTIKRQLKGQKNPPNTVKTRGPQSVFIMLNFFSRKLSFQAGWLKMDRAGIWGMGNEEINISWHTPSILVVS